MTAAEWITFALTNAAGAALLALAVYAATRIIHHAGIAHFLWCVVLLDLVIPPLLTIPGTRVDFASIAPGRPQPREEAPADRPDGIVLDHETAHLERDHEPEEAASVVHRYPAPAERRPRDRTGPPVDGSSNPAASTVLEPARTAWSLPAVLALLWLSGAGIVLALALARALGFSRRIAAARPAPPPLGREVEDLARRAGLPRVPEVLLLDGRLPPLVWAFGGRARVVLPAALLERLSRVQAGTLIAHEIAHIRRRDHWLRWPETLITALYWWCPIAWWARRGLRRAEEECCDGWVEDALPRESLEYAKALMETVDFLSGAPAIPAMASGLGEEGRILKRRFDMILHHASRHRLSRPLRAILLAAAAVILPWAPEGVGQDGAQPVPGEEAETPRGDPGNDGNPLKQIAGDDLRAPASQPANVERRLAALEKQVAALLAELKEMRKDPPATEMGWRRWSTKPGDPNSADDRQWTAPDGWNLKASAENAAEASRLLQKQSQDYAEALKKFQGKPRQYPSIKGEIIHGKRVYRIGDGVLSASEPKSSKNLWVTVLDIDGEIEIIDDELFVTDRQKQVRLRIDPATGKVIEKMITSGKDDALWPKYGRRRNTPNGAPADATPREGDEDAREKLRAEKLRLRERLEEIEAMEAKLEGSKPPPALRP